MTAVSDKSKELLVTFFGLGYAPVAPGTFGTLGGVALAAIIGTAWPEYFPYLCLATALFLCMLGAGCGDWAERKYGKKDPGQYVLDEVAGYMVAVALPIAGDSVSMSHLVIAFFLFRLTDIVKPPPARRLESIPGGWGILADDIVAGAWALGGLYLIRIFFPELIT